MSNDIKDIVKEYVLKNPTSHATDIADLIVEDAVTTLSHRTLRRYVSEVRDSLDLSTMVDDIEDQIADNNDLIDQLADMFVANVANKVALLNRKAKILYLDIETARMIVGIWQLGYKVHVGPEQIIKDFFIYGWAARWEGSNVTYSSFVTPEEALARDDKRILGDLWPLMNDADVIVTHNGDKFDHPKLKTRFIMNGFSPLSSFRSLDTYRIVSKQFAFASNALKFLGKTLTEKEKLGTTYSLWIECEKGVQEALTYMEEYCIGDIDVLQETYIVLRPWMKSHPNLSVFNNSDNPCCPNCASEDVSMVESIYTTQQNAFPEMRCNHCGAVNRAKDTLISTEKRKAMLVPAAH